MSFGQGEVWVDPPSPDELCGAEEPIGACCPSDDGSCHDTNEGDCPPAIGDWKGEGTSCSDDPDPCVECIGAGCEDPDMGACCCDQGTECWDNANAPGEPVICWANQTQENCEGQGGVWQGNNIVCNGQPGICGKPQISGACCMPNNSCEQHPDDESCGLAGGVFFGFGTICPTGGLGWGACCTGDECIMANSLCCDYLTGKFVGGLCTDDPPPCP